MRGGLQTALWAAPTLREGSQVWTTDVCVPLSRLADCIVETKADIAKSHLIAPLVAHAGDGNFHVLFLIDSSNPKDMEEALRLNTRMVERAVAMGGTCTGEHGVGVGKKVWATLHAPRLERVGISLRTGVLAAEIPPRRAWGGKHSSHVGREECLGPERHHEPREEAASSLAVVSSPGARILRRSTSEAKYHPIISKQLKYEFVNCPLDRREHDLAHKTACDTTLNFGEHTGFLLCCIVRQLQAVVVF